MDAARLERIKTQIARAYQQSPDGDLEAMLADIHDSLVRCGLFTAITTRKTGSREHLVEVRCRTISHEIEAHQVIKVLYHLWQDELRYSDYAAQVIIPTDTTLTLDFVTATAEAALWLTGMIVVDIA